VKRDLLAILAVGALLVLAWQGVVVAGGYPPYILPSPLDVFDRISDPRNQAIIADHLWTTLVEVVLGLLVGVSAALVTGFVLARSRAAEKLLSPYIVAAQATPILALAPLIVLWFGSGLASKVLICALICYFPMVVATTVGLRSIDPGLVELGRSLRATRRQLLVTVEVPAALPTILGGLRISTTLAVVGAVVAEWVGGDKGLGVLINLARGSLFDIPLMFAALLTIAAIGVLLYLLVVLLERRLVGARA
jgi:NitT/TauT family transport system permease protein